MRHSKPKDNPNGAELVLVMLALLVSLVANPLVKAWAVATIWGWFLEAPTGLTLPFSGALGISLLYALISFTPSDPDTDAPWSITKQRAARLLMQSLITYPLCVGFAWLLKVWLI